MNNEFIKCPTCQMLLLDESEYHPAAACEIYKQTGQADKVHSRLNKQLADAVLSGNVDFFTQLAAADQLRAQQGVTIQPMAQEWE